MQMPVVAPEPVPEPVRLEAPGLTLNENSLNFEPEPLPVPAPKAAPAPTPAAAAADSGMIEFDLGALSLDLDSEPASGNTDTSGAPLSTSSGSFGGEETADNPLATKLALAEELNAIGDAEGARSYAEEVLAEASGDLKARAQKLLAEIG